MAQVLNPVPALSIFSLLLCKHLSCTLLKMACIHRVLTGGEKHYEMDIFGVRAKIQLKLPTAWSFSIYVDNSGNILKTPP